MNTVRIEQSYRLAFKGQTYQVKFKEAGETTSFVLPDGKTFDLPTTVLNELAFVCPALCSGSIKKTAREQKILLRVGERWSNDEDQKLSCSFYGGVDFKIIAHNHQRSKGAIISRLKKLGHMAV